jgi:hypothetical protein
VPRLGSIREEGSQHLAEHYSILSAQSLLLSVLTAIVTVW